MIVAEWHGGPFDGRCDALPDGVRAVSIAMPANVTFDTVNGLHATGYYEITCNVVRDEDGEYHIIWHEAP